MPILEARIAVSPTPDPTPNPNSIPSKLIDFNILYTSRSNVYTRLRSRSTH